MALSKRENLIAVGTVAAIAIFGIDHFALTPYLERRDEVDRQRQELAVEMGDAETLFQRQHKLRKIWEELQKGGLKKDPSQSESQAFAALLYWARESGVSLTALKAERPAQEGDFQTIGFDVTGNGPMRAISRMLFALETATIPIRVDEVQITPRKEGSDDLSVRLNVSALCLPPENEKEASATANAGGFTVGRP